MDEEKNVPEMNEDDFIVTMYNTQKDCDEKFYLLDNVEYEGKTYAVLQPTEELDDIAEDEVLIMEIKDNGSEDEVDLVPIENEDELQHVFEIFQEHVAQFADEDECGCGDGCCCGSGQGKSKGCCGSGKGCNK